METLNPLVWDPQALGHLELAPMEILDLLVWDPQALAHLELAPMETLEHLMLTLDLQEVVRHLQVLEMAQGALPAKCQMKRCLNISEGLYQKSMM